MNADLSMLLAREHIASLRAEADAARATHPTPMTSASAEHHAATRVVARIRSIGHRGASARAITGRAA
jgi:hypothetical protein